MKPVRRAIARVRLGLRWVWGYGISDPRRNGEYRFLNRVVDDGARVADVGANVGDYTAQVLGIADGVKVDCFEPFPTTATRLRARFADDDRVTVHQVALGARPGPAQIHHDGDDEASLRMASLSKFAGSRHVEVTVTTFDEVTRQSFDFVKIDVEGLELDVLRGASTALAAHRLRLIQFEYGGTWQHTGESIVDASALLQSHGYRLARLTPFGSMPIPHWLIRASGDRFLYSNWIARPQRESKIIGTR